ncbi:hypothetical protein AAY72_08765 [Alishewanella sp. WH16-1]|nr:hypothetical protein AAY72_08765 [Alishewanella sp. WH16-1]
MDTIELLCSAAETKHRQESGLVPPADAKKRYLPPSVLSKLFKTQLKSVNLFIQHVSIKLQ